MKRKFFPFFVLVLIFVSKLFLYGAEHHTGMIKGMIVDADTKTPLLGANVSVMNTSLGASTDADGHYIISDLPVGSYRLQFDYIGYEQKIETDVIVRSQRTTRVDVSLKPSSVTLETVVVTGGYFPPSDEQPVSTTRFSHEEIRRAPGSGGDVSRIIMGLPSIAKVNDQSNSLIVRGGSPAENAFYVDNIEIPNINHFPTQGASGGPIGLINVDFIKDVRFFSGGFSSLYGNRLSSIMDIAFREGNRDAFDAQLDLNFSGFGGVAEGPLFRQKGSWLFSARRSYLDLLIKTIDIGTSVAPRYGDFQGKVVYDLSPGHRLSFLGIFGDDHNNPDRITALENDMIYYGNQDIYEGTSGLNWRAIWEDMGYSNTSLAYTSTSFDEDFFETNSGNHLTGNHSREQIFKFRNVNHFRLNETNAIEFGAEARYFITRFDRSFDAYTDALGNPVPAVLFDTEIKTNKTGLFINVISTFLPRLTATLGCRYDYFAYNRNSSVSPRMAVSYQLSERTSINASAGLYRQDLPMVLLSQKASFRDLKSPQAIHYILGLDHLLSEDTKLTLELYQKTYANFPLDPGEPDLFIIDEIVYRYGFFFNHAQLTDNGSASAHGIELTVQKKLAKDFYGLISGSYSKTQYKGANGRWKDRVFDNRFIFSMEGGYKPNNRWEFSLRWIYAGGAPYTPFDIETSRNLQRAVLDENRINEARYPDYHSLNVRFDRRFYFDRSNLVFYLSIWNAYNRKNIATYFWNEEKNQVDVIYQWGLLPIFGIEFEF